ncbi:TetR/AcrR family transcriptional regulator [Roseomonas sp. CAU 1739]|uniref:TetR/AcrR family transcriptional regulator n=1 Tax=Roseomonas sp. CAU 1739 TaxID=3140364 RepID=UPI00325B8E64
MSDAAEPIARRRLSDEDRCRILREAAAVVFLRDGYAAANMDTVARGAAMSKRTLYQHYPSKAALFEAVMEDCLAPFGMDMALERDPDLATALRGMLEALIRHLFEPRQVAIFRLVIAEVNRSPELADAFHRAGPGRGANSLERRLASEIEQGRLRLTDAREAARMLFGMAVGATHTFLLLGLQGPPADAEVARLVANAVATFLHGTQARQHA